MGDVLTYWRNRLRFLDTHKRGTLKPTYKRVVYTFLNIEVKSCVRGPMMRTLSSTEVEGGLLNRTGWLAAFSTLLSFTHTQKEREKHARRRATGENQVGFFLFFFSPSGS